MAVGKASIRRAAGTSLKHHKTAPEGMAFEEVSAEGKALKNICEKADNAAAGETGFSGKKNHAGEAIFSGKKVVSGEIGISDENKPAEPINIYCELPIYLL